MHSEETTIQISSLNEAFSKKPLTFQGTLNHAPVRILIDSGAMGNFVSKQAADKFSFALHHVSNIPIIFANGATGVCNKAASAAYLRFENHEERIDLRVVSLPHHDIILGKPWLEKWNPHINWRTHTITFPPELSNLQVKKLEQLAILPERKTPQAAGYDLTPYKSFTLAPNEQQLVNTGLALAIPEGFYGQLYSRSSLAKKGITIEGGVIDADYRGPVKIIIRNQSPDPFRFTPGDNPIAQLVLIKITTPPIQEVPELEDTARTGGFGSTNTAPITFISSMAVDQSLQEGDELFLCEITPEGDILTNAKDPRIQPLLQEFHDVFPEELPPGLPPKRDIDHRIQLEAGSTPPWRPIYRMSPLELDAMRKELDKLLKNGSIEPSLSPFGAPVIFIKKKNGDLRMCIDYRALNKITIKNRFPIPLIDDLIDRLHGAKVFTKIDLRSGYNQVRIHHDDIEKTAFRTRYGHYQYKVMPFGLTNAPATFQAMVQDILRPLLDISVIVYIDDILIYSQNDTDHQYHVRQVFDLLRKHKLYGTMVKCEFFKEAVEYLGHIISSQGIATDPKKVEVIKAWPVPTNLKELQSFLGLCNYYRRFIKDYSRIATSLTNLTHKDTPYEWTPANTQAFEELKQQMTEAPVLCIPDPELPFTVTTDASDFAVGAVLSQDQGQGPQPVAFTSRKMNPHEKNYAVHEKETLAIMHALSKWRVYLEGRHFVVFTDHATLRHFAEQPNLTRRQARWTEKMQDYDFQIKYLPGKENVVADAISRRPDLQLNTVFYITTDHQLIEQIKSTLARDPDFQPILSTLQGLPVDKPVAPSLMQHYTLQADGTLLYDQH
jgi:deoxyuridine 5'-triphosphate nucleotidohydrolase